ncbi:acyl-CoA thioester hydrolase [Nocardioides thalensis]|uniref:Acyl-CoA thioester hydrolase n=1 Tax=Nocardioides thalensis TaxID=1914755 RepID=A0A853C8B2_9ACTN|nr:thioesterase family protein [Nocardioides thalensis]NYJ03256.1 acyl-CoA thioester hydrolase [Nocardioides thalensis]
MAADADKRPMIAEYPHVATITTRWKDNDVYGHVNNVTYYSYFDSVANEYLITEGGLDIHAAPVIGLVVESGCAYHAPVAYPQRLRAGLRVDRLGNRAVTYGIGIFTDDEDEAVAHGHFVHVFVDRETRSAVPIPEPIRTALERLEVG